MNKIRQYLVDYNAKCNESVDSLSDWIRDYNSGIIHIDKLKDHMDICSKELTEARDIVCEDIAKGLGYNIGEARAFVSILIDSYGFKMIVDESKGVI